MDRNTPKRKWRRDSLVYDNESELCSTDYEDYVPMASLASIRSFRSSSSAKELVIELEADDKDKAETSTKKSAPISGVEPPAAKPRATVATNTAPTNTETNGLSSDTRQKLLDECKSKLKGKPGNSKLTTTSHLPRKINQEIKRGEPDRKNKSIKPKPLLKDIGVSSAPAKDILRSNKGGLKPTAIQREYVARSIATIKPFIGSMKHSVKDVEANVVEIGDHNFTNVKCHYSSSETTNSDEYYFYKKSVVLPMVPGGKTHQVYATMKTFDHVRAALACQRADIQGEEKPDTPCLCQNCGVLGVLVESQKRPIVTHSVEKLSDSSWTKLKQNTDKRNISPPYHWKEKVSEEVINNLCERVRILELRVQEQEQKAVPRDYFKRVINKIVSYINPKYDFKFDQPCKPHKITTSTQCSTPASKRDVCCKQRRKENVYVQAVLIEQNTQPLTNHRSSAVATENKENILPTHKFTERELGYMSSIWKWGEEVIKPGSDLKHKVVALVDEKLNYIKQPISNKPESTLKMDCDSDKTIFLKGSDDKQASTTHKTVKEPKRDQVSSQQPVPGNNFQKFLDVMSAKIYTDFIQQKSGEALDATAGPRDVNKAVNDDVFKQNIKMQKGKQLRTTPKFPRSHITPAIVPDVLTKQTGVKNKSNIPVRKAMERQMSPMQTLDSQEKLVVKQYTSRNTTNTNAPAEKDAMRGKATNESTVHITYMNPKAKSWFRESSGYKSDNKSMSSRRSRASDVVKLDSLIEEGISRKRQEAEKSGMAKLLSPKSKAKHESIWQAIWNQARAHGKSKQDKVTVQVPADPAADGRGVKEVELTLADLESIVQKHASI